MTSATWFVVGVVPAAMEADHLSAAVDSRDYAVLQRNSVQQDRIAVAPSSACNGDERARARILLDPDRERGLDIAPGVRDGYQDVVTVSGCQHTETALRWTRSSCLARAASTSDHAAWRAVWNRHR